MIAPTDLFPTNLIRAFRVAGVDIRAVGGCVRDTLMGVKPKDVDFCTPAAPESVIDLLHAAGISVIPTGLQHGTVTAVLGTERYEITTLRIDQETDGRHAMVAFTTDWEVDAARRDFTINAMSMDENGVIYDYFGGQNDIKERRVRFVGSVKNRIQEDYLRILRYFRFRGRIGDTIGTPGVLGIIRENADGLKTISGERIWMEMSKILVGKHFASVLRDMKVAGVLEPCSIQTCHFPDAVVANDICENPIVVLAAMLNRPDSVQPLLERWRLSSAESRMLSWLVCERAMFVVPRIADLKRFAADPKLGKEYAVNLAAVCGLRGAVNAMMAWEVPIFPLTGADLIAIGVQKGPYMGSLLAASRRHWVNEDYKPSKEALIEYVREKLKESISE